MPDKCPNCWHGNIIKKVCDDCGHQYGNLNLSREGKRKKEKRAAFMPRGQRQKMNKSMEKFGYDPYMVPLK